MNSNNFVSFITVQGFMFGLVFAILKAQSAEGILVYTLLITLFFYLLSHLSVSFYLQTITVKANIFPIDSHEKNLDYFIREIKKREEFIDKASNITDIAVKLNKSEAKDDKKES